MGRKRHTPEQIITAVREAEVGLAGGKSVKLLTRPARRIGPSRWQRPSSPRQDYASPEANTGVPILAFAIRGIAMSRKGKNGGSCGPR